MVDEKNDCEQTYDLDSALARMCGDEEIYQEVVVAFLDDTPKRIEQMRSAFAQNDFETITNLAHSIKSTAKTIGGMDLGAKAEELEMEGRNKNVKLVKILIDSCAHKFDTLKDALDENGYA